MTPLDLTPSVNALGDRSYTVRQVMALLGKTFEQIRSMRKAGRLQWTMNGKYVEFNADQIDEMARKKWYTGPASKPVRVR